MGPVSTPKVQPDVRHARTDSVVPVAAPNKAARNKGRWRWVWGALVVAGGVVWSSSLRIPAGPAAGASFDGTSAAAAPRQTFRVAVFNIHGGRGTDGRRDLARTADCLRGFDVAGLNEVLGPTSWSRDSDQCRQLGEALGVRWLFAPTESRWWDGSFGNGMLSARPVVSWQRIPLPLSGAHTYRNLILSRVDVDGRCVNVLLTHLDSRDNARRQEQLRTVGDLFLSLSPPAVLMGDMNTQPDDPQMQRLLVAPGVVDAIAASAAVVPQRRIDWILTRGLRSIAAGTGELGPSDHALYWAELQIVD